AGVGVPAGCAGCAEAVPASASAAMPVMATTLARGACRIGPPKGDAAQRPHGVCSAYGLSAAGSRELPIHRHLPPITPNGGPTATRNSHAQQPRAAATAAAKRPRSAAPAAQISGPRSAARGVVAESPAGLATEVARG